jgi:Dyp-type peroxidase family
MHRLQEGIVFEADQRPAPCYRLVLLNVEPDASPKAVREALAALAEMLRDLATGTVRELVGQSVKHAKASAEQFAELRVLIGYGRRLFDREIHDPPLTNAPRPDFLSYLPQKPAAFPAIPWSAARSDPGECDIAIQLTGERECEVNCAAVEIWKLLTAERMPLGVVKSFSGFGRHDGRGWLEFHDGVSNLEQEQRLEAIEARSDPPWMEAGTYMAFLRLTIDLGAWQRLTRAEQELIVGRDKLSGAALVAVARDEFGRASPVAAYTPDTHPSEEALAEWRDPPQTMDPLLEASHIHRANQNRASAGAAGGLRIFRQGYDFFEGFTPAGPIAGLNFVSFQRDLSSIQQLLHLPGWLGNANFGGPTGASAGEPASPALIALVAGGLYALPPAADPYAGASLFERG